jgi:hypothetical protein
VFTCREQRADLARRLHRRNRRYLGGKCGSETASDAQVNRVLSQVPLDEYRHAELAWRFLA